MDVDGGKVLKRERKGRGVTIEGLAGMVGLTSSAIAQYESGRIKTPSRTVVEAIDKALGTTPVITAAFGFSLPVDFESRVAALERQIALLLDAEHERMQPPEPPSAAAGEP